MHKGEKIRGIISVAKKGTGFVAHEELTEDVRIEHDNLNTALHGDEVEVEIINTKKDRAEGKVTKVLSRCRETFVGTLAPLEKGDTLVMKADNQRMYATIRVPKDKAKGAKENEKVLVKMERWESPQTDPVGSVVKVLGRAGEHETEMQAVMATHGFGEDFPPEVLQQAQEIAAHREIAKEEIEKRRDMREVPTFTIDPDDAKDFDDALSVQELEDGQVEIGIHIADVTHYVEPGSAIDNEARERATSVYLVDRVIPMLPEVLSNDICSLVPEQDRLTFSAVFVIDKNHTVVDEWYGRTVIHSNKRFTYHSAQEVLDSGDGSHAKELKTIADISRTLRKQREKEGAISFETDEVKFELAKDGTPVSVYVKERLETMKIVEDFMLLANRRVAEWINEHAKDKGQQKEHQRMFIYRIHDTPDPDRIEDLRIFLKALGYDLGSDGQQLASEDINKLLRKVQGTPEEAVVQMATLRSMAKATYSHKNIGHFSLGFGHYTHFTSPIRRYPDMMVHRLLASHLNGKPISKDEMERYRKAAITASEREVEAVAAERESVKYKQAEYMQGKTGQTFDAIITGVAEHGLYVAEKESRAEGLVHISKLGSDYFELDKKHHTIVGERTGKKYRLGDEVKVKLLSADPEHKQIDWELA